MTSVIESDSYREEERELKEDPIIRALAAEVREGLDAGAVDRAEFMTEDGHARHGFMLGAKNEYHKRGGTKARTIGGPARAVLALLKEDEE
jgi:hypothetical protein